MIIIAPSVTLPNSVPSGAAGAARPLVPGLPAPIPAPVPLPAIPGARPSPLALSAGQTLAASVVRGGAAGDMVLLNIGGKPLEARSTLSLSAGQQLNLNVQKAGAQTVLQLVPSATTTRMTANQGLRVALPRATSLLPLLESLQTMTGKQGEAAFKNLPANVQTAAREVLSALPERHTLGAADGLRRALQRSGHFMESQAARQSPGSALPPADLKAALVRLANVIREQLPAPQRSQTASRTSAQGAVPVARDALPELAALGKASEGAVYRIQSQQLHQASAQLEQPGLLALEFPVRGEQRFDLLRLQVGKDSRRGGEDEQASVWQVVVDLDLGDAGPLQAHVTLRGGSISATLRVQDTSTADCARIRLPELGGRFEQAGLQVGELACLNATPLAPAADESDNGALIEVEA